MAAATVSSLNENNKLRAVVWEAKKTSIFCVKILPNYSFKD